ncbi:MAG: DUF922 domain-containing Zn-dependent protease [Bacteroidia bacterium]|nr:DUF922 domain-containing Zn-dependent protease [Bacteroidia bacterium]NND51924.1 hypothetical protein [Flavobacteriaceae bacterium]
MIKIFLFSLISFFCVQEEPTIAWHPNKALLWSDFKATPIEHHDVVAVTASGLSFHYSTTRYSTGRIDYKFEVTAHFYPEKSWYDKDGVTDITLDHERLHFDITELHARKFRKRVRDTKFSSNIDAEMDVINVSMNEELRKMQQAYDLETQHSRDPEKQMEWQSYISKELDKMKAYAQ